MGKQIHSCYIAAPSGAKLGVLRDALRERNITVVNADEPAAEVDLQLKLRSIFSRVDLVIGVLTSERRSDWILFELGQAWANGRQILLFASPSNFAVPSALQRFLVVRAGVANGEAVGFALDQLLAAPESRPFLPEPITRQLPSLGRRADHFLTSARTTSGSELERVVASAIRESGIEVVSESRDPDFGADLAIWLDDLQSLVGNPILIEVKTQIPGPRDARHAFSKLSSAISSSVGSRIGLLLYGTSDLREAKLQSLAPPNVLVLSIETFLSQLRDRSFADVLVDIRNQHVHGSFK